MALPIQTSTDTPVTLPLACDPLVAAANPPRDGLSPLARYLVTSDDTGLVVPEGAATVTIRALSRAEIRRAEAAAGRHRDGDERVYLRVWAAVAEGAEVGPTLDALDDEEHAAYERHAEWLRRRNRELVRAGLLSLSDVPHIAPTRAGHLGNGYPVEALEALRFGDGLDAEDVLHEVGGHILRVSTLGKAGGRSSEPSSGPSAPTSSSTSSAPTTAAMAGCGPSTAPSPAPVC